MNDPTGDPMEWFEGVIGEWDLEELVQLAPDAPVTQSTMVSRIHFLPDRSVVAVEDSSGDGNNVSLGFHAYDPESSKSSKYINWGSASIFYEGWANT